MIALMGHAHVDPSDIHEFVADVQAIAPGTRAAAGCLFYAVALEDATAGRALIAERWRDEASLQEHLGSPRIAAFLGKWAARVALDVLRFDASNGRPLLTERNDDPLRTG